MNTFLPYRDFRRSAEALDVKRLGKQRVETLQIVRAIAYEQSGWRSHPATVMWRPYLNALIHYGLTVCEVWQEKGFRDTVWTSLNTMLEGDDVKLPTWLGSHRLHASHRSNLLRKDSTYYGQFGWKEKPGLPYFWPAPDYTCEGKWSDHEDSCVFLMVLV